MPASSQTALGLIETQGLIGAIEAVDAMVKAADVRPVGLEVTVGALVTAQVVGEVAAVQAAVEAGRRAAERVGKVVSVHVIPRPDAAVRDLQQLDEERPSGPEHLPASNVVRRKEEYSNLTVRELRALARTIPDFALQGREIARATKKQLIDLLSKQ
jgi:microcompartment protein CcmL/EutN